MFRKLKKKIERLELRLTRVDSNLEDLYKKTGSACQDCGGLMAKPYQKVEILDYPGGIETYCKLCKKPYDKKINCIRPQRYYCKQCKKPYDRLEFRSNGTKYFRTVDDLEVTAKGEPIDAAV